MRFCLSSKQNDEYLSKCQEIKIPYRHRAMILDLLEKYPDMIYIIDMKGYNGIVDWEELKNYNELYKFNTVVVLYDIHKIDKNIGKTYLHQLAKVIFFF